MSEKRVGFLELGFVVIAEYSLHMFLLDDGEWCRCPCLPSLIPEGTDKSVQYCAGHSAPTAVAIGG